MQGVFNNISLDVLLDTFSFDFFTESEAKKINKQIKTTLEIFHKNHFYHMDL
jgi:hypothetical protein